VKNESGSLRVGLLRGINVGKAKRLAMADLRALVESLGYREVRTLLNSGNFAFSTEGAPKGDPSARIEEALEAQLGWSARVIVLDAAGLEAVLAENPLLERMNDPSRLLVAVLQDPRDRPRLEPLEQQDWGADALAVGTRAAYLWCEGGILASPLPEALARALKNRTTTRNWATMLKLQALAREPG
jgi:uncharacterized protein (DUF1697 family)